MNIDLSEIFKIEFLTRAGFMILFILVGLIALRLIPRLVKRIMKKSLPNSLPWSCES
jgi:hypothetical protein